MSGSGPTLGGWDAERYEAYRVEAGMAAATHDEHERHRRGERAFVERFARRRRWWEHLTTRPPGRPWWWLSASFRRNLKLTHSIVLLEVDDRPEIAPAWKGWAWWRDVRRWRRTTRGEDGRLWGVRPGVGFEEIDTYTGHEAPALDPRAHLGDGPPADVPDSPVCAEWPDALPGLGSRSLGPFAPCGVCARPWWSWVRYGATVVCASCALEAIARGALAAIVARLSP